MGRIIVASNNAGKLDDFRRITKDLPITFVSQADYKIPSVEETGLSFVENALLKARYAARFTGLPAVSDDSGIEVDALHGAPGIYSARYAGRKSNDEENNKKLLLDLADIPTEQRTARFYCVIALMRHAEDPTPIICEGSWEGYILTEPHGSNGFGYDPIFYVPTHHCSSAELDPKEKDRISHRGQAMQKLLLVLKEKFSSLRIP